MAIAAPSDCSSLTYTSFSKTSKKPPPLLIPTSKRLSFLPFPSSRSFTFSAAVGCHSPVLQEDKPSSDHPPPVLEFQEFRHDFTTFPTDDSDCLNGFISTMFEDPQTQELAFKYYEKSKLKPEFRPTKSTLNHLVRYLISSKNWTSILSISVDFKSFRVLPDAYTCSRLVTACLKAKKFKLVNSLLEIFVPDYHEIGVLPFDSAMKGYNKLHMYSSTIHVYGLMKSATIALDPGCYSRVMEAYMKTGDTEKVVSLFQQFEALSGLNSKPICRKICRILCESLARSGRPSEALEFCQSMAKKDIPLDHSIYSSLICAFASVGEVKAAEELFEEAERKKMLRDPALFLKLVLMYIEEDLVEQTMEVVGAMKRAKIKVSDCIFSAIVNGFSRRRGLRAAVKVYEGMVSQQEHEPGQVTYASVINVYYRLGLYPKAMSVFSEMEEKGYDRCVVAYSNMVAIYGKLGRLREAMRLVAKMKERGCEPNVWIYNSLLDMHGRVSNLRQVEKTWKEMKRRKIMPDKVSYTSIISAYSRAREFETCMKYYEEFRMNGGVIDRAMAGIMVGIFSKTSQIDDLLKLLRDMKEEGTGLDGRLYRSALNALRDAGLQLQAKWLQQSFGMAV